MADFTDNESNDDMTKVSDGVPGFSNPGLTQEIEKEILNDLDSFNEDEDISDDELICEEKIDNRVEELVSKIEVIEEQLKNETDVKMRIAAEFDNYRKRSAKTQELSVFRAQSDLLESFIPVLDHLEMAWDHAQKSANIESILNGIEMVVKQFNGVFDKWNIVTIDALGKRFDPNIHEAMAQEESHLYESGIIISQWQKGYLLGDRLVRPARVVVSKGPGPAENSAADNNSETSEPSLEE